MSKKPSETEEEYFARQDAELRRKASLEKQRQTEVAERERLQKLHFMHCPKCGHSLETVKFKGLQIDKCFSCNGTWLDQGELEQLAGKEAGFLSSVVGLFKGND
jgi:uncharacterized protein